MRINYLLNNKGISKEKVGPNQPMKFVTNDFKNKDMQFIAFITWPLGYCSLLSSHIHNILTICLQITE